MKSGYEVFSFSLVLWESLSIFVSDLPPLIYLVVSTYTPDSSTNMASSKEEGGGVAPQNRGSWSSFLKVSLARWDHPLHSFLLLLHL
jgi:hypothetical protein